MGLGPLARKAPTKEEPKWAEPKKDASSEPATASANQASELSKEQWLRPFQKLGIYVSGTISGALNGMSQYGRIGSYLGLAGALAFGIVGSVGFTTTLLAYLAIGFVGGLVGGAVLGAVAGGISGGPAKVGLATRKEKYADELAERKTMQGSRVLNPQRHHLNAYNYEREQNQVGNTDRFIAYQQSNQGDQKSWADRVSENRGGLFGQVR